MLQTGNLTVCDGKLTFEVSYRTYYVIVDSFVASSEGNKPRTCGETMGYSKMV